MIDIDNLIKSSMKSRNKIELRAYQNIKAEIQKNQTAKGAKPLTDESQLQIIARYSKNLEDAILQFSEAHREDLVSEYTSELKVVKKLLPEPVNELEVKHELADWFEKQTFGYELGPTKVLNLPKKEMGTAIKYLKSKFPTADGKMISDIVKKYVI